MSLTKQPQSGIWAMLGQRHRRWPNIEPGPGRDTPLFSRNGQKAIHVCEKGRRQ